MQKFLRLEESDIKDAVADYVERRGYRTLPQRVRFNGVAGALPYQLEAEVPIESEDSNASVSKPA